MESKKVYSAEGLIYGRCWEGNYGGYPSEYLANDSREALIKEATEMLDGRLDSGMGFESLKGAMLHIKETEIVLVDGKPFTHDEWEDEFIGDLTEREQDQLENWYYDYGDEIIYDEEE